MNSVIINRKSKHNPLTVITLIAHNLHASIIITDGQCGTVRLHIAVATIVPRQAYYQRPQTHAAQTLDVQPTLYAISGYGLTTYTTVFYCSLLH